MANLVFNEETHVVDYVVKGSDYLHGYLDDIMIVSYEGISDFSQFSYSGTYIDPEECITEMCNEVLHIGNRLTRRDGTVIPASTFDAILSAGGISWFGAGTTIPNGSDLDTYTTPGKYFVASTAAAATLINSPVTSDNFVMYVFKRTGGASISQMIITLNSRLYIRGANSSGVLREWQQYITQSNLDSLESALVEQINAKAPIGYGLGNVAYNLTEVTDANNAYQNGWYLLGNDAANGVGCRAVMRVDAYSSSALIQTVFSNQYSNKYPLIQQRVCFNGTWGEWEWVNPPMEADVLYRTTERYQGKVVYAKLVSFGMLPNNTSKTVGYCSTGSTGVVSLTGMISDGCCISAGYNRDMSRATAAGLYLDNTLYNIRIQTEFDLSTHTAMILVKYTLD